MVKCSNIQIYFEQFITDTFSIYKLSTVNIDDPVLKHQVISVPIAD